MNTQDTPVSKIAAEYIKSQIESHLPGVTLKIKQMPFKQKTTLELANNYEASYSGWSPDYPDPTAFLQTMTKIMHRIIQIGVIKNTINYSKMLTASFYESQVNVIPHYKKRNISYYMKRQSLLFIKKEKHT